jgi:glycosyltransferase involved in cell wall biosynthesis
MRACMVSYSMYDSDNRVRRYAETLVKHGYHVDALSLRRGGQAVSNSVVNGVRVFRLQSRVKNEKSKFDYLAKLIVFFWRSLYFLTREHLKERYDLIHVHSVPDFEVFAALFPKIMGSKVVLDIHDIVPEFYASKFGASQNSLIFKSLVAMERISTAFADHVIASNHIWQKRLEGRSVAESKVTTILNFPDTQVFQPKGRDRNDGKFKFILLYPGTLTYHQGLDIAVRAFSLIKDQVPEAEFHIYGSGDQSAFLKSLVAQLGLENRVFFKGSLAVEQMVRVIENANLGIVPKRGNGFGNEAFSTKILEFMAMGVPVIVPDTEVDSFYFNENVVKFFRANDEKSLADAMLWLIGDEAVRETFVRNATEFVKKYTWDVNQHIYLDLVDSLLSSRKDRDAARILETTN